MLSTLEQEEQSPETLVAMSIAGSRDAFASLVALYQKRVFNFLYQLTRNAHDAEDLTQETFVKAARNLERFDPAYSFTSWLFTIAKRTAISQYRSARVRQEMEVEIEEVDYQDPGAVLEQKDAVASIWTMARQLKPKQYEALWLKYSEGFSVEEIARVMNTNTIYVKVLLHRGRQRLMRLLQENGGGTL